MLKMQTLPDGSKVTGVIRDDDGTPLVSGCIRLDQLLHSGVDSSVELASTDTAVEAGEVEEVAAAAMSRALKLGSGISCTVAQGASGQDEAVMAVEDLDKQEAKRKAEIAASAKKAAKRRKELEAVRKRDKYQSDEDRVSEDDQLEVDFLGKIFGDETSKVTPRASPKKPAGPTTTKPGRA